MPGASTRRRSANICAGATSKTAPRKLPYGSADWIGYTGRGASSSATTFRQPPFAPSGKRSGEETLFGWIVSDFGLNDAIESGLVKTPRVVVRDDAVPDARMYKSPSITSTTTLR